jgi:undecaprenyl phosphate N,N'-diacetylbacillosamine 1-phosphate transferase
MTAGGRALKRAVDLLGSGIGLLILGPLVMLPCALAVKVTSPGPILFRQRRLGRNGKVFEIYKFRSMVVNAPDLRNPDGSTYTGEDDPRVTPVGRFLRKTSLDELPQFLNVLFGHMSLVGPRPDKDDQLALYSEEERDKLQVKPGITGLAQISGRNDISWERRKALDVEYVRTWSIWLDIKILVATVPYVLARKGVNSVPTEQA